MPPPAVDPNALAAVIRSLQQDLGMLAGSAQSQGSRLQRAGEVGDKFGDSLTRAADKLAREFNSLLNVAGRLAVDLGQLRKLGDVPKAVAQAAAKAHPMRTPTPTSASAGNRAAGPPLRSGPLPLPGGGILIPRADTPALRGGPNGPALLPPRAAGSNALALRPHGPLAPGTAGPALRPVGPAAPQPTVRVLSVTTSPTARPAASGGGGGAGGGYAGLGGGPALGSLGKLGLAAGAAAAAFQLAATTTAVAANLVGASVQAASPNAWRTLTGLVGLVGAQLGTAFLPLIVTGSGWLLQFSNYLKDSQGEIKKFGEELALAARGFAGFYKDYAPKQMGGNSETATAALPWASRLSGLPGMNAIEPAVRSVWGSAKARGQQPIDSRARPGIRDNGGGRYAVGGGQGGDWGDKPSGRTLTSLLDTKLIEPRISAIDSVWDQMARDLLNVSPLDRELLEVQRQALIALQQLALKEDSRVAAAGGGFAPGTPPAR